ncbi:unnamed protein product [Notodromas monacha]|uniref:Ketoreductase domain-containing protein n=1 Tax=Notodromas monacha TaxID=399045 RepID=A0A7R9GFN3_9CRUS|nr:unnamed protein product [Notodromas monacha]CAG0919523.1 unnamed protein product [Notodromas monacha]
MFYEGLKDKVVLITGSSSGIGAGTAELFAKHGSKLVLTGRNTANLEEVAKKCIALGVNKSDILTITADLAKEEDTVGLVEKTLARFSRLDILIANAGICPPGYLANTTMELYDEVMNVNLRSVFLLLKVAMPHLEATKGSVVVVSSDSGLRPFPSVVAYCVSKAGLDHLVRCCALDVARKGIRVNGVNPGAVWTDIYLKYNIIGPNPTPDDLEEESKVCHALGRSGTVEEIGKLICFLASSDSSFITGQTIAIDGGASLMGPVGCWE